MGESRVSDVLLCMKAVEIQVTLVCMPGLLWLCIVQQCEMCVYCVGCLLYCNVSIRYVDGACCAWSYSGRLNRWNSLLYSSRLAEVSES